MQSLPTARKPRNRSNSAQKPPAAQKKKKIKILPASLEKSTGYWLIKSEPHPRASDSNKNRAELYKYWFSFDDLMNSPGQTDYWEGVRNYQAKNHILKMELDDKLLFYHSNCKNPGIVGLAQVVKTAYPDPVALDPKNPYYDPKSSKDSPRWYVVDVQAVKKYSHFVPLSDIKLQPQLNNMQLVRNGRLSVQRVTKDEFSFIDNWGRNGLDSMDKV